MSNDVPWFERIRKRPGMYVGPTNQFAVCRLIWDAIDEAVDTAITGSCRRISVTIHPDCSLPLPMMASTQKHLLQIHEQPCLTSRPSMAGNHAGEWHQFLLSTHSRNISRSMCSPERITSTSAFGVV